MKLATDIAKWHDLPEEVDLYATSNEIAGLQEEIAAKCSDLARRRRQAIRIAAQLRLAKLGIPPLALALVAGLAAPILLGVAGLAFEKSFESLFAGQTLLAVAVAGIAVGFTAWLFFRSNISSGESPQRGLQAIQTAHATQAFLAARNVEKLRKRLATLIDERVRIRLAVNDQEARKAQVARRITLLDKDWGAMTGRQFELFLVEVFVLCGHEVTLTPESGDQGADLVAKQNGSSLCVQAKCYTGAVGNKAVQEAFAARAYYGCDKCAVVTNSRFTRQAMTLAERIGCELIDGDQLRAMIVGDHYDLIASTRLAKAANHVHRERAFYPLSVSEGGTATTTIAATFASSDEWQPAIKSTVSSHGSADSRTPQSFDGSLRDVDLPEIVLTAVRAKAAKDHKGDYSTQAYVVDEEVGAYRKLQELTDVPGVPRNVLSAIKENAASEHDGDYSTQAYVVDEEVGAYRKLQELTDAPAVPRHVLSAIKENAATEHKGDYSTQAYVVDEEVRAYRKLQELTDAPGVPRNVPSAIKENAASEHDGDYSTQAYVVDEEVGAYRKLQELTDAPGMPRNVLLAIKKSAASEHDGDYSTQAYVVDEQMEAYRCLRK